MNTHLKPGMFVRLKNQPSDLPDFVVERCLGSHCWIRQQAWGDLVQWKVKATMVEGSGNADLSGQLLNPLARPLIY